MGSRGQSRVATAYLGQPGVPGTASAITDRREQASAPTLKGAAGGLPGQPPCDRESALRPQDRDSRVLPDAVCQVGGGSGGGSLQGLAVLSGPCCMALNHCQQAITFLLAWLVCTEALGMAESVHVMLT